MPGDLCFVCSCVSMSGWFLLSTSSWFAHAKPIHNFNLKNLLDHIYFPFLLVCVGAGNKTVTIC